MISPEKDITSLTRHPQWRNFAAYLNAMENTDIAVLRHTMNELSNRNLIFISRLKAALRMRSENKDLFNV